MAVIDLGFRPREWQLKALRSFKRFNVLVVHRRAGKTNLAIPLLLDRALKHQLDRPMFAYVAPQLNQAKSIAWELLKAYCRKIPGTEINEAELWVELPNKARIRIFGADNPDRLRGMYFDGIVLDEVAQMKPEVWGEIIRPALADRKGWALFIGTPKGVNLFSDLYYKAVSDPDWYAGRWTVYETQALDDDEIEAQRRGMTESQFAQEFLVDFAAASDNILIQFEVANAARQRVVTEAMIGSAAKVIGVDVARQGNDRSVILRRQGIQAFTPKIMAGADSMQVASVVAQEIHDWQPDAVFIDGSGGYGAGVIDRLRQLGHDVQEVQFGGKPGDPRFNNKRTEMWWQMAEWLKTGSIPDVASLMAELCAPTYDYANAAGKLALEAKDKIKERLALSPDIADALALTFANPVAPRGLFGHSGHQSTYDPFN